MVVFFKSLSGTISCLLNIWSRITSKKSLFDWAQPNSLNISINHGGSQGSYLALLHQSDQSSLPVPVMGFWPEMEQLSEQRTVF